MISTSTRNFPNRLGKNTNVYLGSAELAAVCSHAGQDPDRGRVHGRQVSVVNQKAADIYRYMNFDQIAAFREVADTVVA